jgi:hypothetical protein
MLRRWLGLSGFAISRRGHSPGALPGGLFGFTRLCSLQAATLRL